MSASADTFATSEPLPDDENISAASKRSAENRRLTGSALGLQQSGPAGSGDALLCCGKRTSRVYYAQGQQTKGFYCSICQSFHKAIGREYKLPIED